MKSVKPLDARPVLERLEAAGSPVVRASLIRVAAALGDDRALPALRRALRSNDPIVHDAAMRGLAGWPTPAVIGDLVELARHTEQPNHRFLVLLGAIRLSRMVPERTPEQAADFICGAMDFTRQASERKAVLAELQQCATPAALRIAQRSLADPEVSAEAAVAMIKVGYAIRDLYPDEVTAALSRVLAETKDNAIMVRAGRVLTEVVKPVNAALGATATSPDGLAADPGSGGPQAAIDGDFISCWNEAEGADMYRLRVTFKQPTAASAIHIFWDSDEPHQANDFDVLCAGKLVKEVRQAKPYQNETFIAFAPQRCTSLELAIPRQSGMTSPCIHELQIFSNFPPRVGGEASGSARLAWRQADGVLTLLNHGHVVWQWNYASSLPKPYFHPVALLDGTELTTANHADHFWHHGLWFSWKMLNGLNYWEESPATGKSQGITEIVSTKVTPHEDGSARIEMELSYHPPGGPVVLRESRLIEPSAPDHNGVYHIDWRGTFTAGEKGRFAARRHGRGRLCGIFSPHGPGRAGLRAFRQRGTAGHLGQPSQFADRRGRAHPWAAGGWADFSLIGPGSDRVGGIALLDHPANPRYPSEWHNVLRPSVRSGLFGPALLWSRPYKLPAGGQFTLRYRAVVHPGRADRELIEKQWQDFAAQR